jgi:hypothetical protein
LFAIAIRTSDAIATSVASGSRLSCLVFSGDCNGGGCGALAERPSLHVVSSASRNEYADFSSYSFQFLLCVFELPYFLQKVAEIKNVIASLIERFACI